MLVVILASSATLAIDTPRLDKSSPLGHAVAILDIIFTVSSQPAGQQGGEGWGGVGGCVLQYGMLRVRHRQDDPARPGMLGPHRNGAPSPLPCAPAIAATQRCSITIT